MQIWDQSIDYQFILKNDLHENFDGEAFIKEVKGQKISYVVLNQAFFANQAEELFQRFARSDPSSLISLVPSQQQLLNLEKDLLALTASPKKIPSMNADTQLALLDIQTILENLAWLELYQTSLKKNSSFQESKHFFIKQFMQTRMDTVERHEAAHLLDLNAATQRKDQEFVKFSELNAFYTELVYGTNPHDVMAQAIAGLIDEMKKDKMVDYSTLKVATLIQFLKNSKFPDTFKSPSSSCCLEILTKIKKSDLMLAGQELYQKNLGQFPTVAALR